MATMATAPLSQSTTRENKYDLKKSTHEVMSKGWLNDVTLAIFNIQQDIVFEPSHLHSLLDAAKMDMQRLPTLLELESPLFVCGDIHGQLADLRRIFYICGFPKKRRYLFLGDYVDRGAHSIEVIVQLLVFRQLYPDRVFLLRDNHELAHINKKYGFYEECQKRWKDKNVAVKLYEHFNTVFSWMPLSATIAGQILCMHGGISPNLHDLDTIRQLKRPIVAPQGIAQDILWADPECGLESFKANRLRACSYNFGEADVAAKCKQLNVKMIIRAHQVVEYGYRLFAHRQLITVFSAASYQQELCNYAGVVNVSKNLAISFVLFKPSSNLAPKVPEDDLTADASQSVSLKDGKDKNGKGGAAGQVGGAKDAKGEGGGAGRVGGVKNDKKVPRDNEKDKGKTHEDDSV